MALLSLLIFRTTDKNIRKTNDLSQFYELSDMQSHIQDNLSRLESQIIFLSKAPSVHRYLQGEEEKEEHSLVRMFSEIMEHSSFSMQPTLEQMRILDKEGMERIRIDLDEDNNASLTLKEDLQFKGDRYYIRNALSLPQGSLFISPLDLNVENGKIEIPHKPVIRITSPIRDERGILLGYVVLNQRFQSVFDELDQLNVHPGDRWFLLNQEGYYLRGPDPSQEYGFMLEETRDRGFFADYPHLWEEFQNQTEVKESTKEGVYYSHCFDPILGTSFHFQAHQQWYLIMIVSHENIREDRKLLSRALVIGNFILIPLLAILGWSLGISRFRNRQYVSTLQRMATHDDRTGLFNHQGAREQLELLIQLCLRNNKSLCVGFLDMNDLKTTNDTLGHKMGDQLITAMSQSIKEEIRGSDVAARIGGDEFLIIFPEMKEKHVRSVMERIQENFRQKGQYLIGQDSSFSWGVSEWQEGKDSGESIISRADQKMYTMKQSMKNS